MEKVLFIEKMAVWSMREILLKEILMELVSYMMKLVL